MPNKHPFAITIGDASGVGPEILLHAYAQGEVTWPFVAFGDLEALRFYNELLGYGVGLRDIQSPHQYEPGPLNVVDHLVKGEKSRQES